MSVFFRIDQKMVGYKNSNNILLYNMGSKIVSVTAGLELLI